MELQRPPEKWWTRPVVRQHLLGWARLILLLVSIPLFAIAGMWIFEYAHPSEIANGIRESSLWTKLIPSWLAFLLTPFTAWKYARYMFAPIGAFLLVFLNGALYVQDVYALETFSSALRYVFCSMFGLAYPRLQIDGGKKELKLGEIHTLDKIGGPGFALVQPGNAALFKTLGVPSTIQMPRRYFLSPFEKISAIVDLTDQEGHKEDAWMVTSDGIQLHLRDIRFCYRLLPSTPEGNGPVRTTQTPYPFSADTLLDSVFGLSAGDTWQTAIERMVIGEITGFVNKHPIDHLTAPRRFTQDPRRELRMQLFKPGIQERLKKLGAELLWIDVGHMDIVELSSARHENVDGQRLDYWATHWKGEIKKTHAVAKAKKAAYQERGRVDAQARFLQSVMEALRGFEQDEDPAENLRRMLLLRTAEILEGMREDPDG